MSINERTASAAQRKARERARSKAERERALKDWMEQFVGRYKLGFEVDVQEYFEKYGE